MSAVIPSPAQKRVGAIVIPSGGRRPESRNRDALTESDGPLDRDDDDSSTRLRSLGMTNTHGVSPAERAITHGLSPHP